jgi:hypothetical protein
MRTTAALMDRSEQLSDRQRMAAVGSLRAQSAEDLASADYLRRADAKLSVSSHGHCRRYFKRPHQRRVHSR